jgi:trehalose 6-phosphate synthase
VAEELRRAGLQNRMGFFLHTPFPALEVMTVMPAHESLIRSMCAYDLVGFQTESDLRAFWDYIVLEAGGEVIDNRMIRAFGRTVRADVFPIGIDTDNLAKQAEIAHASRQIERLRQSLVERDLIVGVDRLDYSKGLPERFQAFERLLQNYPSNRGRVTFMQIAPPSRSDVPEYLEIRQTLETAAGHINGRFAEFDWVPIRYLNKSFNRRTLAGFFRTARIGLVTPLRDGMNLVAKEYVAAQDPKDPGVLVLSRFAGAARELDSALIVNPYDMDNVAEALERGLQMSKVERRERWTAMFNRLKQHDVVAWREDFVDNLEAAPYAAAPA